VLLGRGLIHRKYRHKDAAFSFGTKLDFAVGQGKERVIFANPNIAAGVPFGAALTRYDVAGQHLFAAENFQPEALSSRIAAVTRRSARLFVCHYGLRNTASETLVICTYTEFVTKASPSMSRNVTYCCSTTSSCPLTAPWPPTSYPSPPVLLSASRVFWPTLEAPAPRSPQYRRRLWVPRLGV